MKKAVCGILIENDKILTVSRKDDHSQLGLVGGKVDDGETHEQAIVREALEETGLSVKVKNDNPFIDIIDDYEVYCFLLEKTSNVIKPLAPEETGIVSYQKMIKLYESSPYVDYNKKAFRHFELNYLEGV